MPLNIPNYFQGEVISAPWEILPCTHMRVAIAEGPFFVTGDHAKCLLPTPHHTRSVGGWTLPGARRRNWLAQQAWVGTTWDTEASFPCLTPLAAAPKITFLLASWDYHCDLEVGSGDLFYWFTKSPFIGTNAYSHWNILLLQHKIGEWKNNDIRIKQEQLKLCWRVRKDQLPFRYVYTYLLKSSCRNTGVQQIQKVIACSKFYSYPTPIKRQMAPTHRSKYFSYRSNLQTAKYNMSFSSTLTNIPPWWLGHPELNLEFSFPLEVSAWEDPVFSSGRDTVYWGRMV